MWATEGVGHNGSGLIYSTVHSIAQECAVMEVKQRSGETKVKQSAGMKQGDETHCHKAVQKRSKVNRSEMRGLTYFQHYPLWDARSQTSWHSTSLWLQTRTLYWSLDSGTLPYVSKHDWKVTIHHAWNTTWHSLCCTSDRYCRATACDNSTVDNVVRGYLLRRSYYTDL